MEPYSSAWFEYRQSFIQEGEIWRLFTGHFVHLSFSHLFLNLSALWFAYFLFQVLRVARLGLIGLTACALGAGVGLMLFSREIDWYVGLSGALHGLFVTAAVARLSVHRLESSLVLALIAAKLTYEQIAGSLPGSDWLAQGAVVVDAHLYGAVSGLAVGLVYWAVFRSPPQRKASKRGATRDKRY